LDIIHRFKNKNITILRASFRLFSPFRKSRIYLRRICTNKAIFHAALLTFGGGGGGPLQKVYLYALAGIAGVRLFLITFLVQ
jgi:hypothetical protein